MRLRETSAACGREQRVAVVKSMCSGDGKRASAGDGKRAAFIVSEQLSCLCDD
jgi:hypothetical protein